MAKKEIFALSPEEYSGCFALVRKVKELLEQRHSPASFNLAGNSGPAAGQTVEHAHIHIVPRYPGDAIKPEARFQEFLPGPSRC